MRDKKIEAIIQKYIKVIQYLTSGGQKPTDSEGNPIVINKTALDILTITVTVQYAFTFTPSAQEGISVFLDNTETNFFFRQDQRITFPRHC